MQNFLKKFGAIFVAIIATVCLAVFAVACGDNEKNPDDNPTDGDYATTTFTVVVQYEDGTPIDGTKHSSGESWINDALWPTMSMPAAAAQVQFCSYDEAGQLVTCNVPTNIGEDGRAEISLEALRKTAETVNVTLFELHICNVKSYGYDKGEGTSAYGIYNINEIPKVITVKLQLAA